MTLPFIKLDSWYICLSTWRMIFVPGVLLKIYEIANDPSSSDSVKRCLDSMDSLSLEDVGLSSGNKSLSPFHAHIPYYLHIKYLKRSYLKSCWRECLYECVLMRDIPSRCVYHTCRLLLTSTWPSEGSNSFINCPSLLHQFTLICRKIRWPYFRKFYKESFISENLILLSRKNVVPKL